jgi:tetratricopeptide (TPR) repeat protein
MKQLLIASTIFTMMATINATAQPQQLNLNKVKSFEHQLDDVMEIIDTAVLKIKLKEVELEHSKSATEVNQVRLGIIYHETALNLTFLTNSTYKGYAKKSFDMLTKLFDDPNTTRELLPLIASYRASSLSLVGGETSKLGLVGDAFKLFDTAVNNYAAFSYLPEFLRGSVAENLPWIFFSKKKFARKDMQSIIEKQGKNSEYANGKIMSFVYWAWANQHQGKKFRKQSLAYLEKAIALDPNFAGGRARAEVLRNKLRS